MNSLPTEILTQILHRLPPQHVKDARLTSRTFNALLAKRTFAVLVSFLDRAVALQTLNITAHDPALRQRRPSIWSPNCSVPRDLPVDEAFLMALWVGLRGSSWDCERGDVGDRLNVRDWQSGVGRYDISEDDLRDALFRYALYLSYVSDSEMPQRLVRNALSRARYK